MRGVSLSLFLGVALAGIPLAPAADGENARTTEVDGTWRLTGYIEDGRPNEDEVQGELSDRQDEWDSGDHPGREVLQQAGLQSRSAEAPKHIDFIDEKGTVVRGVYEIEGCVCGSPSSPIRKSKGQIGPATSRRKGTSSPFTSVYRRGSSTPKKEDNAPRTVEEGRFRLERLPESYLQDDDRQWRFIYDDEVQTSPEPGFVVWSRQLAINPTNWHEVPTGTPCRSPIFRGR